MIGVSITVAALQMQPVPADPEQNLGRIEQAAEAAAKGGASLLVAPEMAVTGYAIWEDIERLAEPSDGQSATRLSRLSRKLNIALAVGFPERADKRVYNAVLLARPDGNVTVYRKCHLYGRREQAIFTPGNARSPIIDIGGLRVGMLICYDVEFPEWVRSLVLAGAELLVVPTALPRGGASDFVSSSLVPTRAYENHVFILYGGLCGAERGTQYQGGSVIVGPDGQAVARAGSDEALLLARLEPGRYDPRELDPYLADRRPELYQALITPHPPS
jgi:predicted amidohydrolase